jgi:hypothetical protein
MMDEQMRPRNLTEEEREEINRTDLEKINAAIDYLTREGNDLDSYQVPLDDLGWEQEADEEAGK